VFRAVYQGCDDTTGGLEMNPNNTTQHNTTLCIQVYKLFIVYNNVVRYV